MNIRAARKVGIEKSAKVLHAYGKMEGGMMGDKLQVNPWTGIWVRPRETIRAIIESNPGYMYPLLCIIYGFPMLLQIAQNFALGDRYPLAGIVIVCLVLAGIIGALMINISTALIYWTGKWIGGIGSYQNIRAAVAWANVPNVVNIIIWGINIGVFGGRIFQHSFVETPFIGGELAVIFLTSIVQVIVSVWALIILLKSLGEVQGFSAWKALLNVIIPIVLIFVGVSILAWLFSMMTGAGTPPGSTGMPK